MSKYTPLTWQTTSYVGHMDCNDGDWLVTIYDNQGNCLQRHLHPPEAEFIVHACNLHDELLNALKGYAEAFHGMVCNPARTLQECDNYRCVTGRYVIKNAEENQQ